MDPASAAIDRTVTKTMNRPAIRMFPMISPHLGTSGDPVSPLDWILQYMPPPVARSEATQRASTRQQAPLENTIAGILLSRVMTSVRSRGPGSGLPGLPSPRRDGPARR
jgi:hypothetical protein